MASINKNSLIILLFILILGAFFRFWLITEIPPGLYPDEAMNGSNALEAIATGNFKNFYSENNGREGFFINLQALSVWIFGNEPWALRLVSAVFGTLTILGVYLLTRELLRKNDQLSILNYQSSPNELIFKRLKIWKFEYLLKIENWKIGNYEVVALLASFFMATSYWHINFSRIGFRAIMVPFFATFGLYFLLKGFRSRKIFDIILAGIFIGLGFHTYIAFRFMPFVLAAPIIWYLWQWRIEIQSAKLKTQNYDSKFKISCAPCSVLLFIFITFVVALPIGYYFLQNPHDFLGRGGQVSVFSSEAPVFELIKSSVLTLGMFFYKGDCNPRHNFNCQSQLYPIVGFFFIVGLIVAVKELINPKREARNSKQYLNSNTQNPERFGVLNFENLNLFRISDFGFRILFLFAWLFFMSLPATLTREGMPHALRSIGMIPPVMILSGLGAFTVFSFIFSLIEKEKEKQPQYESQLNRIKKEVVLLFFLIFVSIPFTAYRNYFMEWAWAEETYYAFSGDIYSIGKYLKSLPKETKKIVVVNLQGVEVRGIPMPAQTVMFVTDTFTAKSRLEKKFIYIKSLPQIEKIEGKTIIAPLNPWDKKSINDFRIKFPELKIRIPGDFIILEN